MKLGNTHILGHTDFFNSTYKLANLRKSLYIK